MRKEIYDENSGDFLGIVQKSRGDKFWTCQAVNRDLGHYGMETEKEAIRELKSMYLEGKSEHFSKILAIVKGYIGNNSVLSFQQGEYTVKIEISRK